ncbi:MAG: maleylacetoacetate isomerase [Pseudomonadota bacterium]
MTDVVLHDYWRSSAAYRVRIALNLKGIAYMSRQVDLLAGDHKAEANRARNPQGLVPTLEIDGLTLAQSLPVIEYLDETRPAPALLPQSPIERQAARAFAAAVAMEIHPVCNMSVARYGADLGGEDYGPVDWMARFIPPGLAALEVMAARRPMADAFLFGEAPGLTECCLIPQLYNARRWEVDLAPYPRLTEVDARCQALAAFAAAHPDVVGPPEAAASPGSAK